MKRNRHVSFEMRLIFKIVIVILLFLFSFSFIFQAFRKGTSVSSKSSASFTYKLCGILDCVEDTTYNSNELDHIPITFLYHFSYSGDSSKKLYYYIISKIDIYDDTGKVVHQNQEVLFERTKFQANGDTKLHIPISVPFHDYYQDFVQNYASSNHANVSIQLILDDMEEENVVSEMDFDFDKTMFQFHEVSHPLEEKEYVSTTSYDIVLASIGLLFALLGLLMVIHISNFVNKCLKKSMNYTDRVKHILKAYDKYIVICRGTYEQDPNKRVIEVSNFKELMDARNTLSVPIVYEKVNNVKCRFYVEDVDKTYLYVMKDVNQEK